MTYNLKFLKKDGTALQSPVNTLLNNINLMYSVDMHLTPAATGQITYNGNTIANFSKASSGDITYGFATDSGNRLIKNGDVIKIAFGGEQTELVISRPQIDFSNELSCSKKAAKIHVDELDKPENISHSLLLASAANMLFKEPPIYRSVYENYKNINKYANDDFTYDSTIPKDYVYDIISKNSKTFSIVSLLSTITTSASPITFISAYDAVGGVVSSDGANTTFVCTTAPGNLCEFKFNYSDSTGTIFYSTVEFNVRYPQIKLQVAANTACLNIYNMCAAAGWDKLTPVEITVNIPPSVVIGSNSSSVCSIITGIFPSGSTLTLNNAGTIAGLWGYGGRRRKCYIFFRCRVRKRSRGRY